MNTKYESYIRKNRGHDIWDIFSPDPGTLPIISLKCDQLVAQEILESFNNGKGVPAHLTWAIKKGKEIK